MKILPINNATHKVKPLAKDTTQTILPAANNQVLCSKTPNSSGSSFFAKIKNFFKSIESISNTIKQDITSDSVFNPMSDKSNKTQSVKSKTEDINRKEQNLKVFELEEFLDNPILVDEFFKAYPNIDLNTKDNNGLTLFLRAVNRCDKSFIKNLERISSNSTLDCGQYKRKYGTIDWNAVDKNGNNAGMLNLKKLNKLGTNDISTFGLSTYNLSYTLVNKLDCNYINPTTKRTLFQEAIVTKNSEYINAILNQYSKNSSNFDINLTHPQTPPALFLALSHNMEEYDLKDMLKNFDVDLDAKYNGKTIFEQFDLDKCKNVDSDIMEIFQTHFLKKNLKKMKEYYDKEGFVSIDQIQDYVKQPHFGKICYEPLNIVGENIGHFIATIEPKNFDDLKKISNIIKDLSRLGYTFLSKDDLGMSAIDKAIDSHNLVVLKLLLSEKPRSAHITPGLLWSDTKSNILQALKANNINDPEIIELANKIFTSY